jgi:membrane-associated protease RseP (regulator of RpoE activity)
MSFYIYDIAFLILFTLAVVIFLYKRRKNLKREGVMYLYRTKIGIKFINYVGTKYKKTLTVFSYLAIISGYILMAGIIYFMYKLVYIYIFSPEVVRTIKVPPIMPLIPYIDKVVSTNFLPPFYFTYWIIAIAVIAIFHEFAHGIIARRYNIKIKTTGFGFLGPFLAAFVEPDEKQMLKKSKFQQIAVLSAGTFTNLILAILFFLILSGFFILTYAPAGAIFNSYALGPVNVSSINNLGNYNIYNPVNKVVLDLINKNKISDNLVLGNINYTKIIADNKTYFMNIDILKSQLNQNQSIVILYYDLPAIETGLSGTIIKVDDKKISDQNDLATEMGKHIPGDIIKITTRNNNEIKEQTIKLGADYNNKSRAVIGIVYIGPQSTSILGKVYSFFNFSKKPATDYAPRFSTDFIVFIYNLIWWLALINLSVALMNMLPFAIFDGGRFFMLTIWGVTKSQRFAEWAFRIANWIFIGIIVILMVGWAFAVF